MTLQITISEDAEERLRRRASAQGTTASELAAEIVESALASNESEANTDRADEMEQQRLRVAAEELLWQADRLAPVLDKPPISDMEKAFDEIMMERARKKGIRL